MLMRNERQDDALDALIDEAARALVAGEPASSLRTGVRERIGSRRLPWSSVPLWATAAATVVAAVLVGRGWLDVRARPDATGPTTTVAREPVRPPAAGTPEPAAFEPYRPAAPSAAPPLAEDDPVIPPIAIAPLRTAQIPVDVDPEVLPIEIEPLQIEPLRTD